LLVKKGAWVVNIEKGCGMKKFEEKIVHKPKNMKRNIYV